MKQSYFKYCIPNRYFLHWSEVKKMSNLQEKEFFKDKKPTSEIPTAGEKPQSPNK